MATIVGLCTIVISLPASHSLKEKRQAVKSIIAKARNEFNLSIGEVDDHDLWQRATLAAACISTSQAYAHGQFEALVRFIERQRPDLPLIDYAIEML